MRDLAEDLQVMREYYARIIGRHMASTEGDSKLGHRGERKPSDQVLQRGERL